MDFEELKVEIPVDNDDEEEKDFPFNLERRYENKSGCFVTGFDVTSKEALERKARRAKRFGLQKTNKDAYKSGGQPDQETGTVTDDTLPSIDVKQLPAISEGEARPDAILVHGVDDMSTKDVFSYFNDFAPGSVEWIDDSSCNVVWDDDFTASRVLMAIGKEIDGHNSADDDMMDTAKMRWKIGPPHPKAKRLLLRLATKKDKKLPGAARRSMYYLINGNPNSSKGSRKGLVSASRKRKIQQEKERAKQMYDGGPEVMFLDKVEAETGEKMEIDEPPLKVVVTNDRTTERSESSNLRMRIYADSVGEDESEEESEDEDKRERRDKWKGRIERRVSRRGEPNKSSMGPDEGEDFENQCKICMDSAIDCVLLECGHMVTCTKCGKQLTDCPICRKHISRRVHVFKA